MTDRTKWPKVQMVSNYGLLISKGLQGVQEIEGSKVLKKVVRKVDKCSARGVVSSVI
jgi:hypothetical protein